MLIYHGRIRKKTHVKQTQVIESRKLSFCMASSSAFVELPLGKKLNRWMPDHSEMLQKCRDHHQTLQVPKIEVQAYSI